jgi:hypothetical protein
MKQVCGEKKRNPYRIQVGKPEGKLVAGMWGKKKCIQNSGGET